MGTIILVDVMLGARAHLVDDVRLDRRFEPALLAVAVEKVLPLHLDRQLVAEARHVLAGRDARQISARQTLAQGDSALFRPWSSASSGCPERAEKGTVPLRPRRSTLRGRPGRARSGTFR